MNLMEKVDLISDEFQSTFCVVSPQILSNLLTESDIEALASIIFKHVGEAKVVFKRTYQLSSKLNEKDIWLIYIHPI